MFRLNAPARCATRYNCGLTSKLSGRTPTSNHRDECKLAQRSWRVFHFIPHAPLQRVSQRAPVDVRARPVPPQMLGQESSVPPDDSSARQHSVLPPSRSCRGQVAARTNRAPRYMPANRSEKRHTKRGQRFRPEQTCSRPRQCRRHGGCSRNRRILCCGLGNPHDPREGSAPLQVAQDRAVSTCVAGDLQMYGPINPPTRCLTSKLSGRTLTSVHRDDRKLAQRPASTVRSNAS
jgi:hypothetical protein